MSQASSGPATLALPTALMHLCMVELLPVWGYGVAILSAARKFMSHELLGTIFLEAPAAEDYHQGGRLMSSHEAMPATVLDHMGCLDGAITDFMLSKSMKGIARCPGCDTHRLFCKLAFLPQGVAELLYGALALNTLLVLWIFGSFACAGLCRESFGSGAYLQFCWGLEQGWVYRLVAGIMAAATLITLLGIMVVSLTNGNPLSMAQFVGFEAIALVLCLKRLLVAKTRVYLWLQPGALDGVLFVRTWRSLFMQPNDTVAAQLVDALWQARCGSRKLLRRLLVDPGAADSVLERCSRLQTRDVDSETDGSEGQELQPKL